MTNTIDPIEITLKGGPEDGLIISRSPYIIRFGDLVERSPIGCEALPECDLHAYDGRTGVYLGVNF